MKNMFCKILSSGAALLASLAVTVALNSVGSTCVFLAYQPDLPEKLRK